MEMAPTCRCRTGSWACFCKLGCPPGRPRRQNAGHAPSRTPIPVMLAQRVRTAGAQARAAEKASTPNSVAGARHATERGEGGHARGPAGSSVVAAEPCVVEDAVGSPVSRQPAGPEHAVDAEGVAGGL